MKVVRIIIVSILILVFVISAGLLGWYLYQGYTAEHEIQNLKTEMKAAKKGIWTKKGYVIAKYAKLWKKNHDIIGWVRVKGTNIDYPVMQTQDDPEFYLRRNLKKEYSIAGTPFLDAKSDISLPTSNWILYGHNMNNGTMFHDLLDYADKEFYESHKTIKFDTIYKGGQAKYEVIAAFYTRIDTQGFRYYNYAGMTTPEQFKAYLEGIKKLSRYDTGVDTEYGDQLITLSTCSYHVPKKKGRFVVVAKRIPKE